MPFDRRVALFDGAAIRPPDVFPPVPELDLYVGERRGRAELLR